MRSGAASQHAVLTRVLTATGLHGAIVAGPADEDNACGEHAGLCAFRADSPGRCPWCHCLWTVIVRSGWHSCEQRELWPSRDRSWRTVRAGLMRLTAANQLDGNADGPPVGADIGPHPDPLPSSRQGALA